MAESLLQARIGRRPKQTLERVARFYETYNGNGVGENTAALAANARALKVARSATFVVLAANSGNLATEEYARAVITDYDGEDVDPTLIDARVARAAAFEARRVPTTLFMDMQVPGRVFNSDEQATERQNRHILNLAGRGWLIPRVLRQPGRDLPSPFPELLSVQVLYRNPNDPMSAAVFKESGRHFREVTSPTERISTVMAVERIGELAMSPVASQHFIEMRQGKLPA